MKFTAIINGERRTYRGAAPFTAEAHLIAVAQRADGRGEDVWAMTGLHGLDELRRYYADLGMPTTLITVFRK